MKIIVAEDENKVRNFITQALEQSGMVVDSVVSLSDLLVSLETQDYDILILDRMLAGKDSLLSLPQIRQLAPQTKILFLSALSEVEEKVKGLSGGADDYLGKPFHVAELVARIRVLSRRPQTTDKSKDTLIVFEGLKIDLETQKVFVHDRAVDLTGKEFRLLCLLARSPGQIFSKSQILNQVWDMNHFPESNVVEVTVANLRSKIETKDAPSLIYSRRGIGYWLGKE